VINGLHPEIDVSKLNGSTVEILDKRTGFHIALHDDTAEGSFDKSVLDALRDFGFFEDLSTHSLIIKQRPIRQQLQAEQRNTSLQVLSGFVNKFVPYYQSRPAYDSVKTVDSLMLLPTLQKADLRKYFNDLIATNADIQQGILDERVSIARTSGTTSERIQVFSDMTLDRVPPEYMRVWKQEFQSSMPRTAVLTSPRCSATECNLGKATLEDRTKYGSLLYLNSTSDLFSAEESLVQNIINELWSFQPEILLVNSIYLHWIGREAIRMKLPIPDIKLVLTSYQYTSKIQKRAIKNIFNADVYNTYSATELAGSSIGVECSEGRWHVREDQSILEFVNEGGEAANKEVGSILVTTVSNRVMPLFRYNVGDLAEPVDIQCDCPLSDWRCFEFHGRKSDAIEIDGKHLTTKNVDDIISEFTGIDFYRFTETSCRVFLLEIVPKPFFSINLKAITENINLSIPIGQTKVRIVGRFDPLASLKYPLVIPYRG